MEGIRVFVRARPLSSKDARTSPWRISGNSIFIHNQPSKFEFDWIFEEECRTTDVYKSRTKAIVTLQFVTLMVKDALETCRKECKDLDIRLTISKENAILEKQCNSEKSSEIDRLRNEQRVADEINKRSQESGKLASLEVKMHNEKAKLRMRLKGAQRKLDTFRVRYNESVDELDYMNRKFDEASTVLKKQLASYGIEVQNLKKQLGAVKGQ